MNDWPREGVRAALDLAEVWRKTFLRHLSQGDDHGWAAHFADMAEARFIQKVKRLAKEPELANA